MAIPASKNLFGFGKKRSASRSVAPRPKPAKAEKRSSLTFGAAVKAAFRAGQVSGDTGLFDQWIREQGLERRGKMVLARLEKEYRRGVEEGEVPKPHIAEKGVYRDEGGVWRSSIEPETEFESKRAAESFEKWWRTRGERNPSRQYVPEAEPLLAVLWKKGKPFYTIPSTRIVTPRQILNLADKELYGGGNSDAAFALRYWVRERQVIETGGRYTATYADPYYAVVDLQAGEEKNPIEGFDPVHDPHGALAIIQAHLATPGNVVQVSTPLKSWIYEHKHAGMFKATDTGLYVQHGKRWDDIKYSRIRLTRWVKGEGNPMSGNPKRRKSIGSSYTPSYSSPIWDQPVQRFVPRFVPENMLAELSNLWHLSATATAKSGGSSRYERMLWTAKNFPKEHPELNLTETAVYKDLDGMLSFGLPSRFGNPEPGIKFILGIDRSHPGSRGGVTEVQSVLFDKGTWSLREAISWLKKQGLKYGHPDSAGGYHRFRQEPTSKYQEFRTIDAASRNPIGKDYMKDVPIARRLAHLITQWDMKQSTRKDYNRYALGLMLQSLHENVEPALAAGKSVREAILSGFHGRLGDFLLRAVGEKIATREERMMNPARPLTATSNQIVVVRLDSEEEARKMLPLVKKTHPWYARKPYILEARPVSTGWAVVAIIRPKSAGNPLPSDPSSYRFQIFDQMGPGMQVSRRTFPGDQKQAARDFAQSVAVKMGKEVEITYLEPGEEFGRLYGWVYPDGRFVGADSEMNPYGDEPYRSRLFDDSPAVVERSAYDVVLDRDLLPASHPQSKLKRRWITYTDLPGHRDFGAYQAFASRTAAVRAMKKRNPESRPGLAQYVDFRPDIPGYKYTAFEFHGDWYGRVMVPGGGSVALAGYFLNSDGVREAATRFANVASSRGMTAATEEDQRYWIATARGGRKNPKGDAEDLEASHDLPQLLKWIDKAGRFGGRTSVTIHLAHHSGKLFNLEKHDDGDITASVLSYGNNARIGPEVLVSGASEIQDVYHYALHHGTLEGWAPGSEGVRKNPSSGDQTAWIESVLSNDEASTDAELIAYFVENGVGADEAVAWMGRRGEYLKGMRMNPTIRFGSEPFDFWSIFEKGEMRGWDEPISDYRTEKEARRGLDELKKKYPLADPGHFYILKQHFTPARSNPSSKSDWGQLAFDAGKNWRLSGAYHESGVADARVVRAGFTKWVNEFPPRSIPSSVPRSYLERSFREGYAAGKRIEKKGNPNLWPYKRGRLNLLEAVPGRKDVGVLVDIGYGGKRWYYAVKVTEDGGAIKLSRSVFVPKDQRAGTGGFSTSEYAVFSTAAAAKKWVREYIAGRTQNPETSSASSAYEEFHGAPPTSISEIREDEIYSDDTWKCGALVELKVATVNGLDATITFDGDAPSLAANADGTQLYFLGGDQALDLSSLKLDGKKWLREHMVIGVLYELTYRTEKGFHNFKLTDYYHQLGEETGVQPMLNYDTLNSRLSVVGGQYHITARGIEN